MLNDLLTLWSTNQATSLMVWVVITMIILYLGRKQAHQVLYSTGRALYRSMRMWAYGLGTLENRLFIRNREILLANGAKKAETAIEKEFARVHDIVQRDLSQYPTLHRQICDVVDQIEVDYQNSTDVAPLPPAWTDLVDAIASISQSGDPGANKILKNIKDVVKDSHNKTLQAYKKSSTEGHKLLGKIQLDWRKSQSTLESVNYKVSSIEERSKEIDSQMQAYQGIRAGEDAAVRALSSSSINQFLIFGFILAVAILGGLINYKYIAMPLLEKAGTAGYIASLQASGVVALTIIQVEIVLGFVLPFALAFIAIPLESFIHSFRVVLGTIAIAVIRSLRIAVRMVGGLLNHLFMICRHLYDFLIVIPLGLERLVKSYLGREIQIDVPVLTRVEAEALKSNQLKSKGVLAQEAKINTPANTPKSKATIITTSANKSRNPSGSRKALDNSSLTDIDLAETMMGRM